MFKWVEPFMWWLCRALAFALQFIGLSGLIVLLLVWLWSLIE